MIDIKLLREDPELFKRNYSRMRKPRLIEKVNELVEKDKQLRVLKGSLDGLRAKRNVLSEEVNKLKKAGKSIDEVLKRIKSLPSEIKLKEDEYAFIENDIKIILFELPNLIHEKVPYGETEKDNVVLKKVGKVPSFKFPVKTHVEILENLGMVDFDASAKATGNGFYYLKGDLALLNQALLRYAIDYMQKKKYSYIEPPLMLKSEILLAAMDENVFENSVYQIKDSDECLIGTSEYAILGMHTGEVMALPKKYFSYSMCFRQEIGAHGINEKGLWRTHQFNKVEQFVFCSKKDSWKYYDELMKNTEGFFKSLGLPYRVVEICTGDLAVWKARSADIEVWRPTTNDYGEVGSLSNCTDYQARNLGIKDSSKEVVHTLNNTLVATSRALVTLVENFQQKDGTVKIPKVLWKYMGGKKVLKKG
jgi:seryl-tRNA synthetase